MEDDFGVKQVSRARSIVPDLRQARESLSPAVFGQERPLHRATASSCEEDSMGASTTARSMLCIQRCIVCMERSKCRTNPQEVEQVHPGFGGWKVAIVQSQLDAL